MVVGAAFDDMARARWRFTLAAIIVGACALHLTLSARAADGLTCRDYATPDWSGDAFVRVVPGLTNRDVLTDRARQGHASSTECSGWWYVHTPGTYRFVLIVDDGGSLEVDDRVVVRGDGPHGTQHHTATMNLVAGAHPVRVRYSQYSGAHEFLLLASHDGEPLSSFKSTELSRVPRVRVEALRQIWSRWLTLPLYITAITVITYAWRRNLKAAVGEVLFFARRTHAALTTTPARRLMVVAAAAVMARAAMVLTSHPLLWPDSWAYYDSAQAVRRGDWWSHEIFRTPLYPAFLSLFIASGESSGHGEALILAQHGLGALTTFFVYDIDRRVIGRPAAVYAAVLWSVSPLTLYYETTVQTETLFAFLVTVTVWWALQLLRRAPRLGDYVTLAFLCAAVTLTRPVGKALVLVLGAALLWSMPARQRWRLGAALLLTYAVLMAPWLYVNSKTYGFVGVSRGQGLGLFMRAFDIERLPAPASTELSTVREIHDELALQLPFLHYPVRDRLNYNHGLSALQTDQAMSAYALDAIRERPIAYAIGVAYDWVSLLVAPHRSVRVCDAPAGPHLCSGRSDGEALGPFSNRPSPGFQQLKLLMALYVNAAYPMLSFGILAFAGAAWLWRVRWEKRREMAVLVATVIYFTVLAVGFNTIEDRYRLPADAFLVILTVTFLHRVIFWLVRATAKHPPRSQLEPTKAA